MSRYEIRPIPVAAPEQSTKIDKRDKPRNTTQTSHSRNNVPAENPDDAGDVNRYLRGEKNKKKPKGATHDDQERLRQEQLALDVEEGRVMYSRVGKSYVPFYFSSKRGEHIRHAVSGQYTGIVTGTKMEGNLFKVVLSGEHHWGPTWLYFDSPRDYCLHMKTQISAETFDRWKQRRMQDAVRVRAEAAEEEEVEFSDVWIFREMGHGIIRIDEEKEE